MLVAGVDVGAKNISAVILKEDDILSSCVASSGGEGAAASLNIVEKAVKEAGFNFNDLSYIVSTGCGRKSVPFANRQNSEVMCQARGVLRLFSQARTIINLGAISSRVISINDKGKVQSFATNDKCAAGSGLFLESMSRLLQVPIEQMGEMALKAEEMPQTEGGPASQEYDEDGDLIPVKGIEVSSRCAVFAESEVISHIHRGVAKEQILAGLHNAVADRVIELISTAGVKPEIVLTGGIARDIAIVIALERKLGVNLLIPEEPQITGAFGAALLALEGATLNLKPI